MYSTQDSILLELDELCALISLHQIQVETFSARREALWRKLDEITKPAPEGNAGQPSSAECRRHPKKWPTALRVSIDGHTIEHPEAAATFVETLRLIGFERVSQLGCSVRGVPLISRSPAQKNYQQRSVEGWWVTTHSSTSEKKDLLHDITKALGVDIRIVVSARNRSAM